MKTKTKKALWSILGISSAAAVSASLVACTGTKFDQPERKEIIIQTGWSNQNSQYLGLQSVIKSYNEWVNNDKSLVDKATGFPKYGEVAEAEKENYTSPKQFGYKPAKIVSQSDGYNTSSIETKLRTKDSEGLFNLLINYPATAAMFYKYEMNLAVPDDVYSKLGLAPQFANVNDTIGYNTKDETTGQYHKWAVPLSSSGEMNSVDTILTGKFLNDLNTVYGIKISESGADLVNKYIKAYKDGLSQDNSDSKYVDQNWNEGAVEAEKKQAVIDAAKATKYFTNLPELNDTIFQSYTKLISFSILAKRLYPNAKSKWVVGLDSTPNAINIMNASISGNDLSKGYITADPNDQRNGGFDYTSWMENGTPQNKVFSEIAQLILDGVNEEAVWLGGDGKYGSSYLVNHNLAFSLGSTAGYSHTFDSNKNGKTIFVIKGITTNDTITKDSITLERLSEIKTVDSTNDKIFGTYEYSRHINKIYFANYKDDVELKPTSYDKILTETGKAEFEKFVKVGGWFYKANDSFKEEDGKVMLTVAGQTVEVPGAKWLTTPFANDKSNYIFFASDSLTKETLSAGQILNEAEADWISAPTQYKLTDPKQGVFVQGPSFIPLHSNEKDNAATVNLLKWLYTSYNGQFEQPDGIKGLSKGVQKIFSEKVQDDNKKNHYFTKEKTSYVPLDIMNLLAGYVSPTQSFFINNKETFVAALNKANQLSFANFEKINTGNYIGVEDIATPLSNPLRSSINSAANQAVNNAGGNSLDLQKFIQQIKATFDPTY
ncbi:hypothetical protein FJO69_00320 [[Mycoplasma] falconis]|uniref:Lipoprotein n=1 Tax=[Mycoplasma] falconis TaxID=92403 RepID=A0A501XCF3_9BACT|nr:P80 family lipoprotein [[Mycoplasma] falconis]TPE58043.1 hypothetical protein FJO69_00320 [[Mycoplasma] falconis]